MKVVIAHRSGSPKVVDLPEPRMGRNFVSVRVSHSALTLPDELQVLKEAPRGLKRGEDGVPLGECASGTVLEVGPSVRTLKTGVRVAVAGNPYVYHGAQLVVPENLAVELPKKVNHEEGAFAGQGAAALHLVRSARVQLGEVVLIIGGELMGLLAAQLVRAAGATPLLVDPSEFRLNKMRTIGISQTFLPDDDGLIRTVDALTGGHGADAALVATAQNPESLPLAISLLRPAGMIVLGTAVNGLTDLELLVEKRLTLHSALGGGEGAGDRDFEVKGAGYPRALARWTERDNMGCFCNLLAERKVQVSPLVTDRLPIERASAVYEKAQRAPESVLGAVLTY